MTKENAFRMVEDLVTDNLREDWGNLSVRIHRVIYNVFLGYGLDNRGVIVLRARLSIPDLDTAMAMTMKDYDIFQYINDRLENIDFEHYY